ncbi:MAG TPA: hypothetical protein IAC74_07045 [Candidatus Aphodoplasma excrementigallinarum]|uniref:Uncharacterized protein n=1 Tax=Candidatus Aphodoplasma excrementigallinarum TaxID=2840673 RepID=A0A9D1NIT0_9FIRM|nr:hypothetical protein [Candidatus Aphodoplasma excrementigallinarum]
MKRVCCPDKKEKRKPTVFIFVNSILSQGKSLEQKNAETMPQQSLSVMVRVFLQDLAASAVAEGDFSCAEGAIS